MIFRSGTFAPGFTSRVVRKIGAWTLRYGCTYSKQVTYFTYYASNAFFLDM